MKSITTSPPTHSSPLLSLPPRHPLSPSPSPSPSLPLLLLPLRSAFEVEMGGERKCLAESVIAGAVVFGEWETSSISKKKRTW